MARKKHSFLLVLPHVSSSGFDQSPAWGFFCCVYPLGQEALISQAPLSPQERVILWRVLLAKLLNLLQKHRDGWPLSPSPFLLLLWSCCLCVTLILLTRASAAPPCPSHLWIPCFSQAARHPLSWGASWNIPSSLLQHLGWLLVAYKIMSQHLSKAAANFTPNLFFHASLCLSPCNMLGALGRKTLHFILQFIHSSPFNPPSSYVSITVCQALPWIGEQLQAWFLCSSWRDWHS